jgi:hypothetical protein
MTRVRKQVFCTDHQGERTKPRIFESMSLVYIKPISLKYAREIGMVLPPGVTLPPDVRLFALCAVDGTTIGITDSWDSAYGAAVRNDFVPLSVH